MTEKNNIPDNDPDLLLARSYGKIVSGEKSPADIEDPLLTMLLKTRDAAEQIEAVIPVRGQEAGWNRIQDAIAPSTKKTAAKVWKFPARQRVYWAAAAAIALLVFLSILLLRQPDPQLIAESGSTISVIELVDGSTATLRPNTQLYKVSISESRHNYALSGEALFDVESIPERIFSVEAGAGRVVVTGTKFNIHDRGERASVYLIEGEVIFETIDRQESVRLSPGEAAIVDRTKRLTEPFTFEPDEITGWTQNRLVFREREAGSIFEELEFHFNIRIEAPAEIRQESLGGSIPLDSVDESLQDLGTVLEGRFVQTEEYTYQFRSGQ